MQPKDLVSCNCDFGTGYSTCHCAGCCRTFTSVASFDMHQVLDDDGNAVCRDPATLKSKSGSPRLVPLRRTPDGEPVWGAYDSRPHPRSLNLTAEPAEAGVPGPRT
jgi:hypothetical protein